MDSRALLAFRCPTDRNAPDHLAPPSFELTGYGRICPNHEVFSEYWYDSENASSPELLSGASFQSWYDDGAGSHLPKCQLQSGEEPDTSLYVNDDQQCDVMVFNAYFEDYTAYVSLLKTYSFKIIEEGETYIIARSLEGYETYVHYSDVPDRILEVYIKAPTGI